ncbi:hypothetical protein LguiB_022428 [Lonicera macranthoides]
MIIKFWFCCYFEKPNFAAIMGNFGLGNLLMGNTKGAILNGKDCGIWVWSCCERVSR